ncbi:F-box/WD repeat-containing protein 4 [Diabrotica virgifera virgifera]|uniref:F-box/WD repeat-containing protein 4-like n=1 Tax=Diabrotica virgifera virgifera TaxID=50390 RepID=A0A6P7FGP3_DIAVI|nr:F-box/WD repeat-containing protein 4 [Diabrotica virgifera virgifera]XP_028135066.1 F-box/WD repeat-containing protein 4 [Diabrotica virgifera virgifera]
MSHLCLENLSTEILIKIFSYLDLNDLMQLPYVCKRIRQIVLNWDNLLFKRFPTPLVTNQFSDEFLARCNRKLSSFEKVRISRNWIEAKYTESPLLFSKRKFLPYLQLSKKYLWISRGGVIFCYKRRYRNLHAANPHYVLSPPVQRSKADVVNFHVKNNLIVAGMRDGSLWMKDLQDRYSKIFMLKIYHQDDVHSVALNNSCSLLASGARGGDVIVSKVEPSVTPQNINKVLSWSYHDVIWKVGFSVENKLAIGTAGRHYYSYLYIRNVDRTDVEELVLSYQSVKEGIHDIIWDGPHKIWTCGYDSNIRMWDLRTGKFERCFFDPCATCLYCMDYDFHNTLIAGAQVHGRCTLWDIRKGAAAQMYFMDSSQKKFNKSSPVYSLAFDAESLFAVTDQNLHVLDFSAYKAPSHDYSFFLKI